MRDMIGNENYDFQGSPTIKYLREMFEYKDGKLLWLQSRGNTVKAGDIAGGLKESYWVIFLDGKSYRRSRLVFAHQNGHWPLFQVDHDNQIKTDDHIENLLDTDAATNAANRGRYSTNICGYANIHWDDRCSRWRVEVNYRRYPQTLKYFGPWDLPAAVEYANATRIRYSCRAKIQDPIPTQAETRLALERVGYRYVDWNDNQIDLPLDQSDNGFLKAFMTGVKSIMKGAVS